MKTAKVTISLDADLLQDLDRLVRSRIFPSRSRMVQSAVREKLARLRKVRLAEECSKLRPEEEQRFAELGLAAETDQWPAY